MDLFEKVISLENLFDAWSEFRKEKTNKKDMADFEMNLEDNIFQLHHDLTQGKYRHGGYSSFFVHDPKRRHIHKASVRDRLLHHAIHRIIEPAWDKVFIFDSWSSRKNKGTHAAIQRLKKLSLKLSHNYTKTVWILKLDIRKFFDSVNHKILLEILRRKIRDDRLMHLIEDIIESYSPGLPLGNLTSQLFSNVYLNQLDQFAKHQLKIQGYIRYADDILLSHTDRKALVNYLDSINKFLTDKLKLSLHPRKVMLKTYASGVDYLGYVCFPHYQVLRTKTKHRMFWRLKHIAKQYNKREIEKSTFDQSLQSYLGVLSHARSHDLSSQVKELFVDR